MLLEELERARAGAAAHLTGAVPPQAVPGLLASMDVAIAPAVQQERYYFSPLKVFEYMAASRPVIAAELGQLAQLVRHGINGLLIPPGDAEALARALRVLASSQEQRASMGRAGREFVLQNWTWDLVWERILDSIGARPALRN